MVATGPLAITARSTAEAFGFTSLAIADIDTPLFGRTESEVATLAIPAAVEAVRLLVH